MKNRLLSTLLFLGALSGLLLSGGAQSSRPTGAGDVEATARPVTVFVLRHAEKGTDDRRDPGLSEAGVERAGALRDLLREAGVTHLFSSDYKRTRSTLEPLVESTGLEIQVRHPQEFEKMSAELWALAPGSVAVVSGHSNTTPGLVRALGAVPTGLQSDAPDATLGEKDYDRLYVVSLGAGSPRTVGAIELRYGRASD